MEKQVYIQIEKIAEPPEKMRRMYEAVSGLVKAKKEIADIKVSDITKAAGIGKGTAYEYFESKEELIAHALMYEYSIKIQGLAKAAFEPETFRERCSRVMDWILENKDYNRMFTQLFLSNASPYMTAAPEYPPQGCLPGAFGCEAHDYVYQLIDAFMEDAYKEGVIREQDPGKRSLALLTAMVEYAFVIMGPAEPRYEALGDDSLRTFIYESLLRSLN